mmetsp:Transcript_65810/g.122742  ORF Transcript_65810/g.122742 Transcript_65810/m.122742 type:complete len:124 (-) Transcript_65810:2158-2529(-)
MPLACCSHIFAYRDPVSATRSLWLPRSTISPNSSTKISSKRLMVLKRWAIASTERDSPNRSKAFCTSCSVCESKADVASSRTTIGGFLTRQRAMASRCFSPPLNFRPLSPTMVSYPFPCCSMN